MVGFTLAILLAVFCQGVNGVINLVAVYPYAGHTFLPPAQRSTNVKRQDIVILPKELPKATVGEEIVFGLFEDINHLKGSINSVKIRQAGRFVWSGVVQDEEIGGTFYLSYSAGAIVCSIHLADKRQYEIRPYDKNEGTYFIKEIDEALSPPE